MSLFANMFSLIFAIFLSIQMATTRRVQDYEGDSDLHTFVSVQVHIEYQPFVLY